MAYSNDLWIPGVESWVLDDINLDLSIKESADDEELDAQEAENLTEQAETQDEGAAIQAADTQANVELKMGLMGFEQIERMNNYLAAGGSYRTLEQLFDMNRYIGSRSGYVSGTEAFEAIKHGAAKIGEFLANMWKKIVELFQRLIPWFGQNLDVLEKRIQSFNEKASKYNNVLSDIDPKEIKDDRKIITTSDLINAIAVISDSVRNNTDPKYLKLDKPARKTNLKSVIRDGNKLIFELRDAAKNAISKLRGMQKDADDGLKDAQKNLRDAQSGNSNNKTIEQAKQAVINAKNRVSAMRVGISTGCTWIRYAIDDCFYLLKLGESFKKKEKGWGGRFADKFTGRSRNEYNPAP